MPAGDRTGPMGQGPMTGRGAGYCAGYEMPGYANPVPRMGMGWGRGRGGGWGRGWRHRHWYYATGRPGWARFGRAGAWSPPGWAYDPYPYGPPPTPEEEVDYLRSEAEWLKDQLDAITSRIEELEQAS